MQISYRSRDGQLLAIRQSPPPCSCNRPPANLPPCPPVGFLLHTARVSAAFHTRPMRIGGSYNTRTYIVPSTRRTYRDSPTCWTLAKVPWFSFFSTCVDNTRKIKKDSQHSSRPLFPTVSPRRQKTDLTTTDQDAKKSQIWRHNNATTGVSS